MKRKDVTLEALHRAALRSTRASAAWENRSVPVGVTRSERVERFLAARLTGIEPGYGKTPVDPEEADALTPQAREIFGDAPKKIDLYEAEQAVNDEVSIAFLEQRACSPTSTGRSQGHCAWRTRSVPSPATQLTLCISGVCGWS